MHYLSLITLLVAASELVTGFHEFNVNHLLLKHDRSQFNLTNVQGKWIEQPLDHFNPSETRTLRIRYYENLDLWQPNGPVYIFIGGECQLNPEWASAYDGLVMAQMAKETNGALYAMEHRYYGESLPNIPNNNLIDYYKFLSSQQAIEDLANFIKMLKSDYKYKMSKVVVVGGSYPGNLAAWLRELHPELVDAAIASSAPVLAKKDFHEYLDVVRYAIGKYGTANCLNNLEKRYKRYEELLKSKDGMETLRHELNICPGNDMTVLVNQQSLFHSQYATWMGNAQYGTPADIKNLCSQLETDVLELDHSNLKTKLQHDENKPCLNIEFTSPTDPWVHQFCTEFGYLITTSSEKQPFVHWNPLEFRLKYCKYMVNGDIEKRLDEGIARTNKIYGGRTPQVSKVVFTNGDMDPWSALGVLHELGPDAPATVVRGTSHCAVLVAYSDEPRELTQNREYVKRLIKTWISETA